jgi:hypothetical protein
MKNWLGNTPSKMIPEFRSEVAQASQAAEKVHVCHPERSEGSAFLSQTQEKADSSGKPSPSE